MCVTVMARASHDKFLCLNTCALCYFWFNRFEFVDPIIVITIILMSVIFDMILRAECSNTMCKYAENTYLLRNSEIGFPYPFISLICKQKN